MAGAGDKCSLKTTDLGYYACIAKAFMRRGFAARETRFWRIWGLLIGHGNDLL